MKRLMLVALLACSSKDPQPEPPPDDRERESQGQSQSARDSQTARQPEQRAESNPADLAKVTTTAPFAITNVAFRKLGTMSGPSAGAYSVGWNATHDGRELQVPAHVRCRVNEHNMVDLFSAGDSTSQAFYPDPFDGVASVCEVRWVDKKQGTVVARACFRDGTLADGACPADAFPAPTLPAGMAVDFKAVPSPKRFEKPMKPIFLNQGMVQMSAIVTVGKALGGRVGAHNLKCQHGATVGSAVGRLRVGLEGLEAGETLYAWDWVFPDNTLSAMQALDRCELELLAVTPDAKKIEGESLGKFCIQGTGDTTPGACEPPIESPR